MNPLTILAGGSLLTGALDSLGLNPISNYNSDRDFSKSVDAQRGLTQFSYDLSQRNWEKQFDKEARYNRPYDEMMRQREAGYNPYVRESAANGTMSMPAQTGSGTAASVNPVPNYVDRYSSAFLDSLKGINQGIVNQKTKDMINASIQNLLADSSNKDAQAEYTQLLKNLEKEFGGKIRSSTISKIEAEAQELFYRAIREDSEGRYLDAAKYESETRAMLNRVLQGKELKEIEFLMEKIKTWSKEVSSIVNLNSAKAGEAVASAKELGARAEMERSASEKILNESEYVKIQKDIATIQRDVSKKTALFSALSALEEKQLINRKLVQEIENAYKENKTYYVKTAMDLLSKYAAALRDGAIAGHQIVSSVSELKELVPAGDGLNSIVPWSNY